MFGKELKNEKKSMDWCIGCSILTEIDCTVEIGIKHHPINQQSFNIKVFIANKNLAEIMKFVFD